MSGTSLNDFGNGTGGKFGVGEQMNTPVQADVDMRWGVKIPLRDGIRLNATLYLPSSSRNAAPAIFTMTPYVGQTYHDRGLYFAGKGYPFLTVDVRGRGNSEGEFRPNIDEARDGYDVVEWLAKQPYCNGQVAMWGGSYGGYAQWVTAKERPPHLATIVPVASPYLGVDHPMRNNISPSYLVQWLTLVSGRTSQDRIFWGNEAFWAAKYRRWFESGAPFRDLDTIVGVPSAVFQEWLAHPRIDAYWERYNPTSEEYSKLSLPVLTITGCYDGDQPGALTHYREHMKNASEEGRARHYLVIGPWDHAGTRAPQREFAGLKFGPASLVDLSQLHAQWYAWTMQGAPRPEFLKKNVAYYLMGAERWCYADSLEAITSQSATLYLNSNGSASGIFASGALEGRLGNGPADEYVFDPRDTAIARLDAESLHPLCLRPTFPADNLTDQTRIYANEGKHLIYHSTPFREDANVSGFFRLSAWISIDQPDTDFSVAVYEIDVDGGSILLSSDLMRARYRESLREEKLIRTVEPLRYDFERFTFVSRRLKKGSRLRLVIGPVHSIHTQKNYNSGGIVSEESADDARSVTVKLYHDESHPSALYVPLGCAETQSLQ
jgi:putative CocE/NonD family hydrolase